MDSDDHGERVTEGLTLVEVQQNVLIDGLGVDPVAALREELSQLGHVAAKEALLVQEVALPFVLVRREGQSFADSSRLLHLHGDGNVFSRFDVDGQEGVLSQDEVRGGARVELLDA